MVSLIQHQGIKLTSTINITSKFILDLIVQNVSPKNYLEYYRNFTCSGKYVAHQKAEPETLETNIQTKNMEESTSIMARHMLLQKSGKLRRLHTKIVHKAEAHHLFPIQQLKNQPESGHKKN